MDPIDTLYSLLTRDPSVTVVELDSALRALTTGSLQELRLVATARKDKLIGSLCSSILHDKTNGRW